MSKQLSAALAALTVAVLAAPARAQNFQNGSPDTVWRGNLRLTASPVYMFASGDPSTTGGAFRLGYGITDAIDVEAKSAFFGGLNFVGGDGHLNLLSGETALSVTVGGHRAMFTDGPDSNALDLAAELGQRLGRRAEVYLGPAFSYESISGSRDANFTRWYLVPGMKLGIANRLDLLVEGGVGLNDNSPHYITAGLALHVPAAASARGGRH